MKKVIHTNKAPKAVGPYSQAISLTNNKLVFLSGQIGLDPLTGKIVSDSFEDQVRQSFKNMYEVIKASGGTLDNIIKLNLFLTDLNNFSIVNNIMSELLSQPYPARSTVEVKGLPKNAKFEIEAIISL
ncbi:Putative reactive intermediate deaminase TdcF [Candidatus Kinetoplastibacterium sorsogonicusi]|uniref:Reactive intermediate deaminase TdcF n=2 Tax=Candidatus Kinetoplastidibacterium kentomonadis TaxID=1576550 RepID=A0A3Q8ERK4_9PROT|nr:Putative reactive intermediate deaminase TdcF [Candidatus Kinetoplastibacterium sorsogonicusi]